MDNGISDGTNMTGAITREQFAAILYRYAKQKGYDISKSADLNGFADADAVSGYATDAMRWARCKWPHSGFQQQAESEGHCNTGRRSRRSSCASWNCTQNKMKLRYLKPNIA